MVLAFKNRIAFKAIAVSVMIKLAIQSFCIHTQVTYGQVLKEKAECL